MNDFVCVSCVFHGLNIFFLGFLPSTRLFKRTFSMTILGFTLFLLYFVGFTMCVSILAGSLIFVETESRKDLVLHFDVILLLVFLCSVCFGSDLVALRRTVRVFSRLDSFSS